MSPGAPDPDPEAFAALLCDWCLEVRAGQEVLLSSTTLSLPLLRAPAERRWPNG
jgi:leucyl aminopeptidase (aminopeptidase T)